MTELADRLREVVDDGTTQQALAARLGTSQQNVARWLSGAVPSPKFREQLARVLGVSRRELDQLAGRRRRRTAETAGYARTQPPARRPVITRIAIDTDNWPLPVDTDVQLLLQEREQLLATIQELALLANVRLHVSIEGASDVSGAG